VIVREYHTLLRTSLSAVKYGNVDDDDMTSDMVSTMINFMRTVGSTKRYGTHML